MPSRLLLRIDRLLLSIDVGEHSGISGLHKCDGLRSVSRVFLSVPNCFPEYLFVAVNQGGEWMAVTTPVSLLKGDSVIALLAAKKF